MEVGALPVPSLSEGLKRGFRMDLSEYLLANLVDLLNLLVNLAEKSEFAGEFGRKFQGLQAWADNRSRR